MPVRLDLSEKARENLEAVERLRADDDGLRDCLTNAVANRAYFAAYLAVAHVAQQRDLPFERGADYYKHDELPRYAAKHGILSDEGRLDLTYLRGMRIKADYQEDAVELEEAEKAAEIAGSLVGRLLP